MNRVAADRVYRAVAQIPAGKVATYGQIAKIAQVGPRAVGYYLHRNPDPQAIPCHRVVNGQGKVADHFAFGGAAGQMTRLQAEGVVVENGQVGRHYWQLLDVPASRLL